MGGAPPGHEPLLRDELSACGFSGARWARIGQWPAQSWAVSRRPFRPFIHIGHFVHLASLVVGNPLPDLLAGIEVPGPHFGAVLPKPFPITFHLAINDQPFAFHAAVLVQLDVFCLHGLLAPFLARCAEVSARPSPPAPPPPPPPDPYPLPHPPR